MRSDLRTVLTVPRFTRIGIAACVVVSFWCGFTLRDRECRRVHRNESNPVLYALDNYRAVVNLLCVAGNDPGKPDSWLGAWHEGRITTEQFIACTEAWRIHASKR